jgi:hypothetical protein
MRHATHLALLLAAFAAPQFGCVVTRTRVAHPSPPPRRESPPPPRREAPPPHIDPRPQPAAFPPRGSAGFHIPPDRVPGRGLCRIWYDDLPPDRQPPSMDCGRAHRLAQHHGGRVVWAESSRAYQDGSVATTDYGRVDLRGIPPDRMPPPGYCRVWLDGVPPDRQPEPGPCPLTEHEARRSGGRLLYMPSADGR